VDDSDLAQWADDLGVGGGSDADGNLRTDGADFLAWQRQLGTAASGGAAAGVPEPGRLPLVNMALIYLSYAKVLRRKDRSQRSKGYN
jgi:hypothetical protein